MCSICISWAQYSILCVETRSRRRFFSLIYVNGISIGISPQLGYAQLFFKTSLSELYIPQQHTIRLTNVGLMLVQRCSRWAIIRPVLVQRILFTGITHVNYESQISEICKNQLTSNLRNIFITHLDCEWRQ